MKLFPDPRYFEAATIGMRTEGTVHAAASSTNMALNRADVSRMLGEKMLVIVLNTMSASPITIFPAEAVDLPEW